MNPHTAPFSGHTAVVSQGECSAISTDEAQSGPNTSDSADLERTANLRLAGSPDSIAEFALTQDGCVPTWGEAVARFRARLSAESSHAPRFSATWAQGRWARLLEMDRELREHVETTVLITLTGRTKYPDNGPFIPPCIHFDRLNDSRQAIRQRLSRLLDGYEWNSASVVGVDHNGYCHRHIGIYVEETLGAEHFEPIIKTHLENCPIAGESAHGVGAISVDQSPSRDDTTGLTSYLGCNVPGLDTRQDRSPGVLTEPEHRVRGAVVLEASGRQALRLAR